VRSAGSPRNKSATEVQAANLSNFSGPSCLESNVCEHLNHSGITAVELIESPEQPIASSTPPPQYGSGADLQLGHRRHKEGRGTPRPVLPPTGPVSEQHHRARPSSDQTTTNAKQGFREFQAARRTIQGYEAMNIIRKGQVRWLSGSDVRRQNRFINQLFEVAK
jgi:hypothetical protein